MSDTLHSIARQLAKALDIEIQEDKVEIPETFAGLHFSQIKTKSQIKRMHVTLLQRKDWKSARRAVVMNNRGEITSYLGVALPLSDGRFATYK